jgi:hypothetical protein
LIVSSGPLKLATVMGGTVRDPGKGHGVTALVIAGLTLAIIAAPASATTDRADYAAQVNSICRAQNTQLDQLFSDLKQKLRKSRGGKRKSSRNSNRAYAKYQRLVDRFYDELFRIENDAETQIEQVAAAPGDESTVSTWTGNRRLSLTLSQQAYELSERFFGQLQKKFSRIHSLRGIKRFEKKRKRIESRINGMYAQIEAANNVDLELGTALGATYCVTSASGGGVVIITGGSGTAKSVVGG